jgi:glyoxylase-like metal-dependent hydrolase (beta-lactamase superfamily II)
MERITLSNLAFEGDNNVYLFADGAETMLVDTGDWRATTRDQMEEKLGMHGVVFADIDRIFLTHWHPDHTGLAGEIQAESGADVWVHERDAPLVAGDKTAWAEMHKLQDTYYERWGIPDSKQSVLRDIRVGPDTAGKSPNVTTFEDGDVFSFNGYDLEVVHTSGHADGLCMFEIPQMNSSNVLSGDALLPEYTPNVGGADVRVEQPLEKYLHALQIIVEAEYDRAWPGHRDPLEDPAKRAREIIHHHAERAWHILDVLRRRGPCDPWKLSQHLFGELKGIHILHGPGECYAHLEHLQRAGTVIIDQNQYRIDKGIAQRVSEREQYWPLDIAEL